MTLEGLKLFELAFGGVNGWVGLFFLHRREGKQQALQISTLELERAATICEDFSSKGYDAYFSPSPLLHRLEGRRRGKKEDYMGSQVLWVDLDPSQGKTQDDVVREVQKFDPKPTIIVNSGNGVHAYWRLQSFENDHGKVEKRNLWLANQLGGDHCHSIDHLLRVPGTINWKGSVISE
jgi:hypothetical protein